MDEIICGDCVDVMSRFDSESIDLVVTSPPYDSLRSYHGYEFDFPAIAKQLYRVVKIGGVVVWVVGDTTKDFCESLSSFKQAIEFVNIGFNLLDTMIYMKKNYAPAYPAIRRYANVFEYMFVFSKGKPTTFNPIQEKRSNATRIRQQVGQAPSSFVRQDGTYKQKTIIDSGRETKDATNIRAYGVGQNKSGHPAPFPEQLATDHILSWSNSGDLVCDPLCGSGTTCVAAERLKRHWIGIDVSEEYCEIARKCVGLELMQPDLFDFDVGAKKP